MANTRPTWLTIACAAMAFTSAGPVCATAEQTASAPAASPDDKPAEPLPDAMQGVGVTEHLGATVPKDLAFVDSQGKHVTLGEMFDGRRPVILTLNYSNCPMLCSLQLNGLFEGLQNMPWDLGQKYQMVTVSIDPLETTQRAAQTKDKYLRVYGRPGTGGGWQVLTGPDENIHKLADTVGFGYRYDAANKQYAHAAVTMICTPDGRLSRYLYGVQYDPQTLRFSLLEAADGKVGTTGEQVLFFCYRFDEKAGRYVLAAMNIMKAGGVMTIVLLAAMLSGLWVRQRRRTRMAGGGSSRAPARPSRGSTAIR
jgi:protein SCO1